MQLQLSYYILDVYLLTEKKRAPQFGTRSLAEHKNIVS